MKRLDKNINQDVQWNLLFVSFVDQANLRGMTVSLSAILEMVYIPFRSYPPKHELDMHRERSLAEA